MSSDFLKKNADRLGAGLEKMFMGIEKSAKDIVGNMTSPSSAPSTDETPGGQASPAAKTSADQPSPGSFYNKTSLAKVLTSAPGLLGDFYFPSELIGGCCPRVAGDEEEIVWNAAAEACDSERVHVVWQAIENRIWYVAVRSAEIASHPNTWCPFASLLPGMKDAQPAPVCYTYYSDEAATMLTITSDGLQIHRGMSSVVRAKAERTGRDLGGAPVIELIPERILKLTPAPWYSISLFEDRARRILAAFAVLTALGLTSLAFMLWLLTAMFVVTAKAELHEAEERASSKTLDLVRTAAELRASPMREQLSTFAKINDGLLAINGYLEVYDISDGKQRWRAIVPGNVTADRIGELDGKTLENLPDGRVAIGNANQLSYEAANRGKKR